MSGFNMIENIFFKKKLAYSWFTLLQQIICYEFEKLESDFGKKIRQKPSYFKKNNWEKPNKKEGGGNYSIMKNGLVFAGIDIIGEKLTEINVTSPTGFREIFQFDGVNLAKKLLKVVLK